MFDFVKEVRGPSYHLHDAVFHLVREFGHCREQLRGFGGSSVDSFDERDLLGHEQSREEDSNPLDVSSEKHFRGCGPGWMLNGRRGLGARWTSDIHS